MVLLLTLLLDISGTSRTESPPREQLVSLSRLRQALKRLAPTIDVKGLRQEKVQGRTSFAIGDNIFIEVAQRKSARDARQFHKYLTDPKLLGVEERPSRFHWADVSPWLQMFHKKGYDRLSMVRFIRTGRYIAWFHWAPSGDDDLKLDSMVEDSARVMRWVRAQLLRYR